MSSVDLARKRALDVLAACDAATLHERYAALEIEMPAPSPVRGPEIGMVMLRGRAGGGGALFNLGEATVSRASVRIDSGEIGHSVILGRDTSKAQIIAHLDALAQRADWTDRIEREFVVPALETQNEEAVRQAAETEATRVDFFTLVRGED